VDQPVTRQVIHFGCSIPFQRIPDVIARGFEKQEKTLINDARVMEHYQLARSCLERCLGDPLCDLLLMIALTFAASSKTPTIRFHTRPFDVGRQRDPGVLVANLVTRMLWFFRPQDFPWDEDEGQVLRISEMARKTCKNDLVERGALANISDHKGVTNLVLWKLGWIQVQGNRNTPRHNDCRLRERKELLALRTELLSLLQNPPAFIARVFNSHEPAWVERCGQIIKEEVTYAVKSPRVMVVIDKRPSWRPNPGESEGRVLRTSPRKKGKASV
jgi:hypothetical protein